MTLLCWLRRTHKMETASVTIDVPMKPRRKRVEKVCVTCGARRRYRSPLSPEERRSLARGAVALTLGWSLFLGGFLLAGEGLPVEVLEVYDGDSITVDAVRILVSKDGHRVLDSKTKIRVCCMDTPEMNWRAKCDSERELATAARDFVVSLIGDKVELHDVGLEKYNRVLARVWIPADEVWLDERLIELGLARPYHGEGRKSWCDG